MDKQLKELDQSLEGLYLTPLDIVEVQGGNVLHGMKSCDQGYEGFGEAYFSMIESGVIKGWKRHKEMTLNLIVPIGSIRFIMIDENKTYQVVTLSNENYKRLTVPPMLWMAFQGISENTSMVLNIANIPHDPDEIDRKELNEIAFDWSIHS